MARSLVDVAEEALRTWLATGRHRVGERLPPEQELSAQLGISRGTLRTALGRLFATKGIDAIIVATAAEALTLVREQHLRPDVLLCDYNLLGSSDGVETIRHLRAALGRNIPAVVMTGDTRSQTALSITAQGASLLIKPFLAEELLEALRGQRN